MALPIAQLSAGALVGQDFRVCSLLAQGGMGAVYLVEQLSTGKQRALKVMHPSLVADPGMRERFVQEARVGSMIPSDHVVEVVAAGIDQAVGLPWLAMELLSGEDLAAYVARRGPLPLGELPVVLRPILHALSAAHARGIVHRDIKPENVFLATTMSSTHPVVVKVLDFGIAKVAAQALGTATTAVGSPLWMAPEQTELRSHVAPATDVWALGLLTYWLLTGRPYWRAGAVGGSAAQLMREILFDPIEPASARAAEQGVSALLPPGFDAWFGACVARDQSRRFRDATEAGARLFQDVLGTAPSASLGLLPSAAPTTHAAVSAAAQTLPSGAGLSGTAAPTVSSTTRRAGTGLGLALVGGGLFALAAVVAVGLVGAYFVFSEPTESPEARPPTAPSFTGGAAGAVPGGPVAVGANPHAAPPSRPTSPMVAAPPGTARPTSPSPGAAPVAGPADPLGPAAQATSPNEKPPVKAPYSAGDKVDVLWSKSWWQGQILAVKGEKYLVHYIGWSSSWDEWVTTARLRPWTGSARTK